MRLCVENELFFFENEERLTLLQFCYASLLSAKHLGDEPAYLLCEIRDLSLAIWKNIQTIDETTELCRKLVARNSTYMIDFRYAAYAEIVFQSPHYIMKQTGISVRNYLAIFMLKSIVAHKLDFWAISSYESVDISNGMVSLFKELSDIMNQFITYITPETNSNHKKCTDFEWQLCVATLLSNSIIFPQIPRHGEKAEIDDDTKKIMESMRNIAQITEKWQKLLSDNSGKETQAKTRMFFLKIDYSIHLKELDEYIANPTVDQLKKQNKQTKMDNFLLKSPTK